LSHDRFARSVHTRFRVGVAAAEPVELEIVTVSDLQQSTRHSEFALEFRGPRDRFIGQGTFGFEHDDMGRFDLFIVPIGLDAAGYRYEAIFNQLREGTAP